VEFGDSDAVVNDLLTSDLDEVVDVTTDSVVVDLLDGGSDDDDEDDDHMSLLMTRAAAAAAAVQGSPPATYAAGRSLVVDGVAPWLRLVEDLRDVPGWVTAAAAQLRRALQRPLPKRKQLMITSMLSKRNRRHEILQQLAARSCGSGACSRGEGGGGIERAGGVGRG